MKKPEIIKETFYYKKDLDDNYKQRKKISARFKDLKAKVDMKKAFKKAQIKEKAISHMTKVQEKNLSVYDVFYNKKPALRRKEDEDHVIKIEIEINQLKKFANNVDIKDPEQL